jgi:hypothetical protein
MDWETANQVFYIFDLIEDIFLIKTKTIKLPILMIRKKLMVNFTKLRKT